MKTARPSLLKWPTLLLVGVIVLASFSLRTIGEPPVWHEKTKIGFIGDSITRNRMKKEGVVDAEMALLKGTVAINQGKSGSTTVSWQPGHALFDDALTIFKTQNVHVVSIMLGTNDSRADVATSPAMYRRNMEKIVEGLLNSGVVRLVIINYTPYVVPGKSQLRDDVATVRLQLYRKQLDMIVQERQGVVRGDTEAFEYFKQHPKQLADGVHPTDAGNKVLGRLWAQAYQRIVSEEATKRQSRWIARVLTNGPTVLARDY